MSRGPDPQTLVQRVLLLERQQGYQDRAAVGGIASFLDAQVARNGGPDAARLRAVAEALQGYATADRRQREEAVSQALEALLVSPSRDGVRAAATPSSVA